MFERGECVVTRDAVCQARARSGTLPADRSL